MLIIKGNLIVTKQVRNYSETSSEEIVAYADLSKYDLSKATILVGDIVADNLTDNLIAVTGEVSYE